MRSLFWIMAILLAPAVDGSDGDRHNAAYWYQLASDRLESTPISEKEWDALDAFRRAGGHDPSDEVRAVLDRMGPVFSAVRRGAKQGFSDFALDYEKGFDLTLPHLGNLRKIARLMTADASRHLSDGHPAQAAERISTLWRVAGHLSSDQIIISSLVGQAIFQGADRVARSGLDQGVFDPVGSRQLLGALVELNAQDPFDVVGGIEKEGEMLVEWARQKYAETEDRAGFVEDIGLNVSLSAVVAGMTLVDEAQFENAIGGAALVTARAAEMFRLDDPDEARFELQQIGIEVQRGDHGVIAMVVVPAYMGLYERMNDVRERIAQRRAMLEAIVAGRVEPADLTNAAVWYLRAIDQLQAIQPARRERIRAVATDPSEPIDDGAAQTLKEAASIVETLRQASQMDRCDFSIARNGPSAIPGYPGGMREAVRLLHADAVRLFGANKTGAALDRLAICYRMAGHLARDRVIASSLVSQATSTATEELVRLSADRTTRTGASLAALHQALGTLSRWDPFGFDASLARAREELRKWLSRRASNAVGLDAPRMLVRLDPDRLLYLHLAVYPTLWVAEAGAAEGVGGRGLDDVIDIPNLIRVVAGAQETRRLVTADGPDVLLEQSVPELARLRQRMQRATADLKRIIHSVRRTGDGR